MLTFRRCLLLVLALLLGGCASAAKRYEQGLELEMSGRYDEASYRYVQALQKDPSLVEVRSHLEQVSERAVAERLEDAESWSARGKSVEAASRYQQIDGIVARAHSVGVRIELLPEHDEQRRECFDRATESLLRQGEDALERSQWSPAASLAYRAGTEFEPTLEQSDRALGIRSHALVGWSRDELDRGHLRAAYERASAVLDLDGAPPGPHTEAAHIRESALAQGQVELLALPVIARRAPETRRRGDRGRDQEILQRLEIDVNDALDRGPWRTVSPFVKLTDPIRVREIVRQAERLQGGLRAPALGLLLQLVDADYGAWLELSEIDVSEFDVRQTPRSARTRDGESVSFVLEEGQRRMQVKARVIVVDSHGNEITDLEVLGRATAPFREGVYDGDPADLNLSRRDVDAFDELALLAQEQELRRLAAEKLSRGLAAAVLDPVMARIP